MKSTFKASIVSILLLICPILKAQITYKDIAPILIKNCTSCHHDGGVMFSLTKYSEVKNRGNSIKNDVQTGYMPPWPPDANYRKFTHQRIVSTADKNLLVNWINNGMVAGDTTLAPKAPIYSKSTLNGKPDLILKLPKYKSTAVNNDHYYCLNVPSGITADRFIKAFEFIPGRPDLIHHVVITIDTTGKAMDNLVGDSYNDQGQIGIGDFAPGTGPSVFPSMAPAKMGFRLKSKSVVSFQIHVPEGTDGEVDSTSEIHFFFYPLGEPNIRELFFETVLQNWSFNIPANSVVNAKAYFPSDQSGNPFPLPIDFTILNAWVHSHNTCTSIINYAYKGTDTIPLIKVPNWDFHWQGVYTYEKLLKMPAGYTMFSEHKFDNTVNNPRTPDHNQPVMPGLFTRDEMLFDSYTFTSYIAGDENIDIAAILAKDPLFFTTSTDDQTPTVMAVKVYPNPFTDQTKIEYTLLTSQYVTIKIFNTMGQEVSKLSSKIEGQGAQSHTWDGTDSNGNKLQEGVYFYQIQAGQNQTSGKILLK
jgi:Secretion system C-terminal sorting domain